MVSYPCPFCGAPAGLESGCSRCGRPPFPDAAEVVRLNGRTRELHAEAEAARAVFGAAALRYNEALSQRNMLAARVKAAVALALRADISPHVVKNPAPAAGTGADTAGADGTG